MSVIGVIKLAPGMVGFYDELTRIHLTIAKPEKTIVEGMKTDGIKKAIKSGRLLLVSGTLEFKESMAAVNNPFIKKAAVPTKVESEPVKSQPVNMVERQVTPVAKPIDSPVEKPIDESSFKPEVIEEPVLEEALVEEIVESPVVEEPIPENFTEQKLVNININVNSKKKKKKNNKPEVTQNGD